jgi:hypothetical protein
VAKEFTSRLSYPNPFEPSGIEFELPDEACVTLKIYDDGGKEIATLLDNQKLEEGAHRVDLHQLDPQSGVYFYRLSVDRNGKVFVDTKRIV